MSPIDATGGNSAVLLRKHMRDLTEARRTRRAELPVVYKWLCNTTLGHLPSALHLFPCLPSLVQNSRERENDIQVWRHWRGLSIASNQPYATVSKCMRTARDGVWTGGYVFTSHGAAFSPVRTPLKPG
eukprot:355556-Chlamydomonas_euryale.AAC.6